MATVMLRGDDGQGMHRCDYGGWGDLLLAMVVVVGWGCIGMCMVGVVLGDYS